MILTTQNSLHWLKVAKQEDTLALVKQRTASRLRQFVLGIRVVNDRNSLDESVVMAESVNAFKTELKHLGRRRILNMIQLGTMAC